MPARADATAFALRFVSGKYQGGLYPLREGREIVIGRSSDADLVLTEDNVSRRHAKVRLQRGVATVQDLGSTNGTFVNGERVKKRQLVEGDRILVGGSIFKLVRAEALGERQTDAGIRAMLEEAAARAAPQRAAGLSGRLEEVPLPDLLQLLAGGKKSGALVLEAPGARAEVHLREGRVVHCAWEGKSELPARKCFERLLAWREGEFRLEPGAATESSLDEPVEGLLLEGMRGLDELRGLEGRLPPRESRLGLASPLAAPLRDLSPQALDVLQLALNHGEAGAAVDRYPGPDAEAWRHLLDLVEKGYLRRE